jgi:hypothetical protein
MHIKVKHRADLLSITHRILPLIRAASATLNESEQVGGRTVVDTVLKATWASQLMYSLLTTHF